MRHFFSVFEAEISAYAILCAMIEYLKMIFLAVVQGLTEFLPISSSGHLVLAQHFVSFDTMSGLGVELLLHAGTLVAVLYYYRAMIAELIRGFLRKEMPALVFVFAATLSMIPAVVIGLIFEEELDAAAESPIFVCSGLIITGCLLLATRLWAHTRERVVSPLRGLAMGVAQAIAMLPGISRSGSTIAVARFLGVRPDLAAAFSFLMVVPVIIGGNLLHIVKMFKDPAESAFAGLTPGLAVVGFVVAAIVGYASVAWMVRLLNRRHFWRFGFYCLALGIAGLIHFIWF